MECESEVANQRHKWSFELLRRALRILKYFIHNCATLAWGRDIKTARWFKVIWHCVQNCMWCFIFISMQIEAPGHRVHEAVAWESQCHPTDRQSRHPHSRRMPTVQETGQQFPQLLAAAEKNIREQFWVLFCVFLPRSSVCWQKMCSVKQTLIKKRPSLVLKVFVQQHPALCGSCFAIDTHV